MSLCFEESEHKLAFHQKHALVIIENEYNFIKDLVQSVKFGGDFIPNLYKTTVVFFLIKEI